MSDRHTYTVRGQITEIEFTIPLRLYSEANLREHWAKKSKRACEQRGMATYFTRQAFSWQKPKMGSKARVILTRIAPRKFDDDNLARSFKAVRDGIADALGIDDGSKRIKWEYEQRLGLPKIHNVLVVIAMEVVE